MFFLDIMGRPSFTSSWTKPQGNENEFNGRGSLLGLLFIANIAWAFTRTVSRPI